MFDDKEQVFCEEKKNGLLFTGCVTENGMNSNIVTLSSGTAGIITVHIMENVI